jgi:hypothetical protein
MDTVNQSSVSANPAKMPRGRSAVSNGTRLFVSKPGDSAWSRRFRDLYFEILSDVAGPGELSEGQRQLARRCATLALTCEKLECDAASGMPIDSEEYGRLCDRLGRALAHLNLRSIGRQSREDQSWLGRAWKQIDADKKPEPVSDA